MCTRNVSATKEKFYMYVFLSWCFQCSFLLGRTLLQKVQRMKKIKMVKKYKDSSGRRRVVTCLIFISQQTDKGQRLDVETLQVYRKGEGSIKCELI